jgi:ribokinase
MSASRILVLGSINLDLVVQGEQLPAPGETVSGGSFFQASGGKGANQAVAAARVSDEPVVLIAATGGDLFGRQLRSELARENLCMDHVFQVDEEATGVALVLVDRDGENCISVAPGANRRLDASHLDQVQEQTWQAAAVFLASLEVPLETVAEGLKRARAHGLTTILNPAPARGDLVEHPLMQEVDLLTPNRHEAELMTGIAVVDLESAGRAGRQLQERGPRQVIITRGAEGAVVIDDQVRPLPAIPVEVVDTTAAGDCFNGVLAAALARQQDLVSAARQATIAAGICVTRPGAQPSLPTREELDGRALASQESPQEAGQ